MKKIFTFKQHLLLCTGPPCTSSPHTPPLLHLSQRAYQQLYAFVMAFCTQEKPYFSHLVAPENTQLGIQSAVASHSQSTWQKPTSAFSLPGCARSVEEGVTGFAKDLKRKLALETLYIIQVNLASVHAKQHEGKSSNHCK